MQGAEPQLPDGVNLGEVFAGRYRLDAIIGQGAMGVVVAAHDRRLDIPVAIKLLLGATPDRSEAGARFVQEARAAARLRSEHVVRVSDIAVHESGVPYLVMERLTGSDLATLLRNGGPLPVAVAVDYLLEACEAIDEAHRRGIVHRDLKPANLFLAEREHAPPVVKVLDFGVAKMLMSGADTVDPQYSFGGQPAATEKRAILGSPFYMSPEQMESSGDVDARTDIWALGVTLFELVVGEPPYRGTSLVHVYARMTMPGEHPWKARLSRLAPAIQPIVAKCLDRDRENRYASVADLAADLAPLGSSRARDSEQRIRTAPGKTQTDPLEVVNVITRRSQPPPLDAVPNVTLVRVRERWRTTALVIAVGVGCAAAALIWRGGPPTMLKGSGPTPPASTRAEPPEIASATVTTAPPPPQDASTALAASSSQPVPSAAPTFLTAKAELFGIARRATPTAPPSVTPSPSPSAVVEGPGPSPADAGRTGDRWRGPDGGIDVNRLIDDAN